ncbi:MAG: glycosyltransferase family 39 protein [Actinomycetota bacterium]
MWLRAGLRYVSILAALAWAVSIYYLFFHPFTHNPVKITAICFGLGIAASIGIYSMLWHLIYRRSKIGIFNLEGFPGLFAGVIILIIAISFLVAALLGDFRRYLGNNIQEVIFLTAIILSLFGIGDSILSPLRLHLQANERIFISITLGLGIMSLIMFTLGVTGQLYALQAQVLILSSALVGLFRMLRSILRSITVGDLRKPKISSLLRIPLPPNPFALCIAILLALCFAAAWMPINNFDSLLYHIAVPKLYISAHRIYYIKDFLPSNYPLNGEMLFLLSLLIKDDTLAQLFSYFISIWLIFGVYIFCQRFFSNRSAAIGAILALTIPSFAIQIPINNNDTTLALFMLASIFALVVWWQQKKYAWLYLSGLMLGFAAGSKYSGFFGLAVVGLMVVTMVTLANRGGQRPLFQTAKIMVSFIAATFIGVGPWLIKNCLFTGNPIYPMFASVLGGRDWIPSATKIFTDTVSQANYISTGPLGYLLILWHLSVRKPAEMTIGPAIISFLPFILRRDVLSKSSSIILLIAATGFLASWVFTLAQVARFALPGLILLCIVIASGIDSFISQKRAISLTIAALLLAALLGNLFLLASSQYNSLPVSLGLVSHKQFLESNRLYQTSAYINNHIPKNKKVAMIIDNRTYYLNSRPVLILNPLNNGRLDQVGIKKPSELMRIFKNEKVDYVFATDETRRYVYSLPPSSPYGIYRPLIENVDHLIRLGCLKAIFRAGDFWLYKVNKQCGCKG